MSYHSELDADLRALAAACADQQPDPAPADMPTATDPTRALIDELQAQYTARNQERVKVAHNRRKSDRQPWRKAIILLVTLVNVAACCLTLSGARWYGNVTTTANAGIVWNDLGGVELYGQPGPFLCPAQISPLPALPEALPGLVVDC